MKRFATAIGVVPLLLVASVLAEGPVVPAGKPVPPEQFAGLHRLIKPQEGEIRFWDIPWLLSIGEARQRAAAEGKPMLVWSGAGGPPIGLC